MNLYHNNIMELSESFYIFLTTSTTGLFLAILKALLYDSKCKNIKLCGLEIERDINAERDIENHRIDVNQSLDRPVQSSSIN